MDGNQVFTAIGENIHCTRVYKTDGRHVQRRADGGYAVRYTEAGEEHFLPIPSETIASGDWLSGKLKHVDLAIRLGLRGDAEARRAGRHYLQYLARRQEGCGVAYLDLNVDEFSTDPEERKEAMVWAAGIVQSASNLPLSIDSANVDLLETGLSACTGGREKPLLNSVSLEREEAVALAARLGAAVVAGAGGKESMPAGKKERLANAGTLVEKLHKAGIAEEAIYLDPLVMPVSVNPDNGRIILETIKELRRRYGAAIHFAPGLSNISFGMPQRRLLNLVFTFLCRQQGADGGIVDPLQINPEALAALDTVSESFRLARAFLVGEDQFGMSFISAVRENRL